MMERNNRRVSISLLQLALLGMFLSVAAPSLGEAERNGAGVAPAAPAKKILKVSGFLLNDIFSQKPGSRDRKPLSTSLQLNEAAVRVGKGLLALFAMLYLFVRHAHRERGFAGRYTRAADALLAALAVIGVLAWCNFGKFHFSGFVHLHDMFHYYLGAKYLPETGYTRLYDCAFLAAREGQAGTTPAIKSVRNLGNNRIEGIERILENEAALKQNFSASRWEAFRSDVVWFRNALSDKGWADILKDHGFNATPVWALAGGSIANRMPLSAGNLVRIALIDSCLLVLMWVAVCWGFGWRTAAIGMVFWGANILGDYSYTGGSLLRFDWLVALVAGISCLKRERPVAAGFLLALSALSRLFPALVVATVLAGLALQALGPLRAAALATGKRLVAGCALCAVPLIVATLLFSGGACLREFAENVRKHYATPFTNNVSLSAVLAFKSAARGRILNDDRATEPWDAWKTEQNRTFHSRRVLYGGLVILFLALVGRAAMRHPPWVAAVLGAGVVPVVAQHLSSYYLVILLVFTLLWEIRPAAVFGLLALAQFIVYSFVLSTWNDEIFAFASLGVVCYLFACVAYLAMACGHPGSREPTALSAVPCPQSSTHPAGKTRLDEDMRHC